MIKCNYSDDCSELAVVFDLSSNVYSDMIHCFGHYSRYKVSWDRDVDVGISTWSEQEYIEDKIRSQL